MEQGLNDHKHDLIIIRLQPAEINGKALLTSGTSPPGSDKVCPCESNFVTQFGHLLNGYNAIYLSTYTTYLSTYLSLSGLVRLSQCSQSTQGSYISANS